MRSLSVGVVTVGKVKIAKRIWAVWDEGVEEHGDEYTLDLLLSSAAPAEVLDEALRWSVEIQAEVDAEAESSDAWAPPFAGEWSWMSVAGEAKVSVTDCNVRERVLTKVVSGLERRGISGTLALWRAKPGVALPSKSHMLICHMRVRGDRQHPGPGAYRWQAHTLAHAAVVAAADRWCRCYGPQGEYALSVMTSGPVARGGGRGCRHPHRAGVRALAVRSGCRRRR